jgi:FkbM family methyltransferase
MFGKILVNVKFSFYKLYSKIFSKKRVRLKSSHFYITTSTENEVHRAFTFHEKEPETLQWIDSFSSFDLGKDDLVFFDVGANIGIYSLYMASRYSNSKVFAFEPDSQSFGSLCKNIYINNLKIQPYPFAISDKSGIGIVQLSTMNAGAGACALGEEYRFATAMAENIFKQGVFFCSLDELFLKYQLPIPTFIKIDVDGIESTILHGSKEILGSSKCKGLLVEFQYKDESNLNEMMDYLKLFGFTLSSKSNWIAVHNELKSRNFIFSKN